MCEMCGDPNHDQLMDYFQNLRDNGVTQEEIDLYTYYWAGVELSKDDLGKLEAIDKKIKEVEKRTGIKFVPS